MLELYNNERKGKQKYLLKAIINQNSQKKQWPPNHDTYLTDELFVRWRPVERLWEDVKIKRLYNIPVEVRKQDIWN